MNGVSIEVVRYFKGIKFLEGCFLAGLVIVVGS